ncbi:SRPBCC family protein [Actinoplanes sp. NPDC049596]|uniref:SRPBCC family protein n=1 Tax=unclassified Actinoplanes TaxID=2626549 RepID=UPI003419E8E7
MDVKEQISQVRRTLGSRVLEAGEARVMTISQQYDTDIDDLWEVVTSAERIPRWFMPISGELKEGGRYELTGNASGTISRCDKPNGYSATWEFAGQVSWIEVRLRPSGSGTLFELEHVAHVEDQFWDVYGPGAVGVGWDLGLFGLAGYLHDPATAPDPASMQDWHTTAEGQTFMRLSSDAWAAAAVADGESAAVAQERADRTYGFYTGTAV